MYTIVLDPKTPDSQPVIIDNDHPNERSHKTISPQLELEENAFGSLSFTLPCQNEYYSLFDPAALSQAEVRVYHAGESDPVFRGRLLEVKRDSQMNRNVIFEGELAYLADSVQEPAEYKDVTPQYYVGRLLAVHNRKFPNQQFALGNVTVKDNDTADHITGVVNRGTYTTSYSSTTWSCLQSLVSELGGFLSVRWSNGVRYLDYLKDHPDDCNQTIDLGVNMLDYAEEWSLAELYTVVVPLGASVETGETNENGTAVKSNLTIASVNNGSVYCEDRADIIERYGRREKAITFSGIQDPYHLKQIAILYLNNIQFDNMTLSLTALDLSELGADVDKFKFHSVVHATAEPFGLVDKAFPITKMSIPLKDPAHAVYSMSTNTKGIHSLSEKITDIVEELTDTIDETTKEPKEIPKYSAGEAGTPDDWIFGIPLIVYRNGERGSKYIYRGDYMLHVWDAVYATHNFVTEIWNKPGTTEPQNPAINTQWPELWMKDAAFNMTLKHGENTSGLWGDVATSEKYDAINFDTYVGGVIPFNFQSNESGARVVYVIAKFKDPSKCAGLKNNAVIGYHQSTSNVLYGISDSGHLCLVEGSNKTILYSNNSTAFYIAEAPVVMAFARGVVGGTTQQAPSNLIIGAQPSNSDLGSNVYSVFNGYNPSSFWTNYGICINYITTSGDTHITPEVESGSTIVHDVDIIRVVECYSPVPGQITMDEVYENVKWFVGRYVTGSLKDGDKLPDPSNPEPEPEEEEGES